ncbi:WD repeat domain-containing protein 83 [Ceratocystis fimbriata CBS 114723]|uniref:WD repeat domain-containing protein 83 n=1 Tax=Ceratocystis fimbriata CBS 114723 TaxID=1035309 RepID=A0A2C5X6U8_9PEZI|nr:WD repeat domain-containing protein 83 [Ceratocystis fimbriata CBS 114723]
MAFPDRPVAHLLGSNGPVHTLTYSAYPGTYILTGSADRSIRLYNPEPASSNHHSSSITSRSTASSGIPTGRLIQTYSAHGYEVLSLAVSSDNERFASGGGDRLVFLWDVASATTLRRFGGSQQGHSARINAVAFAGAGDSVLVSAGFDTTVRLWDLKAASTSRPIQVLADARDAISALAVRETDIWTASVDGRLRRYDLRMARCFVDAIGGSLTSLDATRDGHGILASTLDGKIRLMDRDKGTCLKTYETSERVNKDLRVQSLLGGKEKYVVSGDEEEDTNGDARLWAWDLLSGKVVKKISVSWGPSQAKRNIIGSDGKPKTRKNIISSLAWRDDGWGDQLCVAGTSGVVTVYST